MCTFPHIHNTTCVEHLSGVCHFNASSIFGLLHHWSVLVLLVSLCVSLLARRDSGIFCNLNDRCLKLELYLEAFPCSQCEAWARFGCIYVHTLMACQCLTLKTVSWLATTKAQSIIILYIILLIYVWLWVKLQAAVLKKQIRPIFSVVSVFKFQISKLSLNSLKTLEVGCFQMLSNINNPHDVSCMFVHMEAHTNFKIRGHLMASKVLTTTVSSLLCECCMFQTAWAFFHTYLIPALTTFCLVTHEKL